MKKTQNPKLERLGLSSMLSSAMIFLVKRFWFAFVGKFGMIGKNN